MFRFKTEAFSGYLTFLLKKCSIWFEKLNLTFFQRNDLQKPLMFVFSGF